MIGISTKLGLNIDKAMLFDEIVTFDTPLSELNSIENNSDVITKYCKLLSKSYLINILKIIESVLAIPIGNDFVERVFSHMNKIWTDERNRMSIGLSKAEICIKNNFSFSCIDFKEFIQSNENCIKAAKSNEKYLLRSK